jgi:hypothetical protein
VTEAAVGDPQSATKGRGRLARVLSRKKRDPADTAAVPTGYQPFSNKLAPGLISFGAIFSVFGALGAWIRTSRVVAEGLPEEQVGAVMGYDADWGRLIAVVAGVTLLSAIVWVRRNLLLKLVSAALCIATIVLAALRLPVINDQAAGLAFQARTGDIDFISFHAGFGWGAWCLIFGAVALFLGLSAGFLRELDVRKGIGG